MDILDLHAHILPNVDDGAANLAESIEMLQNAAASNVVSIVATPHSNIPGHFHESREFLQASYNQLCADPEIQKIPINILLGSEVHVTDQLPALLKQGAFLTLNQSRYLLTEFPIWTDVPSFHNTLSQILLEGYTPLVAHPERYASVCQSPGVIESWLDMGCHIQLTAGSIMGKFGAEAAATSKFLLEHDFVACVASDAHGVRYRTNYLGDVCAYLSTHYSPQYAALLLWDNPVRICNNQNI